MKYLFSDTAWTDYLYWQQQDKKTLKKINNLLESISRNGALEGIGKPELLKYSKSGQYSRRIDETNRLVYRVEAETVIIDSCLGHYEK
ncbi:Txe/YoeB family addiction module toxin [bacterium]|nr:Txe/YoeB family addiction module toxin [bacterium]